MNSPALADAAIIAHPSADQQNPRGTVLAVGTAFAVGYLFSLWYLYIYYLGDQEHYTRFYHSLYGMDPKHWKTLQASYIGSAEPLYRYVIGIAAYFGVDRIQYLSVWNGVLTGSITYILIKYRSSLLFAALVLTNYYLFVIMGPAERLKFGYIFLILATCVTSIRSKYVFSVAAIFFHTQSIIQFLSSAMFHVTRNYKEVFATPGKVYLAVGGGIVSLGAVGYMVLNAMGDTIASKSAGYASTSGGLAEVLQWALLFVAGLAVFRDKLAFVAGMLPVGVFTVLYGNRVNVATLAFFAAMALSQRKTRNPVVLAVMGYMSFKSIGFISDVMQYGTGY